MGGERSRSPAQDRTITLLDRLQAFKTQIRSDPLPRTRTIMDLTRLGWAHLSSMSPGPIHARMMSNRQRPQSHIDQIQPGSAPLGYCLRRDRRIQAEMPPCYPSPNRNRSFLLDCPHVEILSRRRRQVLLPRHIQRIPTHLAPGRAI